jgi:hypothetical protein
MTALGSATLLARSHPPNSARSAPRPLMPTENAVSQAELARLVNELESAEAYEVKLRQLIVDVRDQLAAGNTANALSMLNQALNYIDDATDVVTSTPKQEAI